MKMIPLALAPATVASYRRHWRSFEAFAERFALPVTMPIAVDHLSCFMMELLNSGASASSISSMLSAFSYFHKLEGGPDPTHSFFIRQLAIAVRRQVPSSDSRVPITEAMLFRMVEQIAKCGWPIYDTVLFQATFLFAFYFGLRVSEFTSSRHNILRKQLEISNTLAKLTFLSFKHSKQPETHSIASIDSPYCTVKALLRYLAFRGNTPGPLFLLHGKPITSKLFSSTLNRILGPLGLSDANIKAHSFRIGAASYWVEKGLSEVQIRQRGRWNSNAMVTYFRGEVKHNNV